MNLNIIFQLMGLLSVLSFAIGLICVPWLINKLDDDFFTLQNHKKRIRKRREQHPLMMVVAMIIRHCAGFILLVAGLTMLFIPGQGVLTILAALVLMEFPGKYRLVMAIVRQKRIRRVLDWIRKKGDREPFVLEDKPPCPDNLRPGSSKAANNENLTGER